MAFKLLPNPFKYMCYFYSSYFFPFDFLALSKRFISHNFV